MTAALPRISHGEEALAWQVRAAGLPAPVREHRFDPSRRWRFDFAWTDALVALEVEGGQWIGGHGGRRFESDASKYNVAAIAGWLLLRVTTAMVDDGRALQFVADALASRAVLR